MTEPLLASRPYGVKRPDAPVYIVQTYGSDTRWQSYALRAVIVLAFAFNLAYMVLTLVSALAIPTTIHYGFVWISFTAVGGALLAVYLICLMIYYMRNFHEGVPFMSHTTSIQLLAGFVLTLIFWFVGGAVLQTWLHGYTTNWVGTVAEALPNAAIPNSVATFILTQFVFFVCNSMAGVGLLMAFGAAVYPSRNLNPAISQQYVNQGGASSSMTTSTGSAVTTASAMGNAVAHGFHG